MTDKPLSVKDLRFVDAFMGPANGVGAAAAKYAGYKGNAKTLTTQAQRMLAKASIQHAIAERRALIAEKAVPTSVEVALRLAGIGMGIVTERHVIGGKDDFVEVERPMPGAVQVSALKALNAQMGYDAATKTELSGTVGVVALTAEQAEALDIWLLVRDDPRVLAVIAERTGER